MASNTLPHRSFRSEAERLDGNNPLDHRFADEAVWSTPIPESTRNNLTDGCWCAGRSGTHDHAVLDRCANRWANFQASTACLGCSNQAAKTTPRTERPQGSPGVSQSNVPLRSWDVHAFQGTGFTAEDARGWKPAAIRFPARSSAEGPRLQPPSWMPNRCRQWLRQARRPSQPSFPRP